MQVKSESEVAQLCPTLRDLMDCSPPGSSLHGVFQARVLEWGAIAFSEIHLSSQQIVTNQSFSILELLIINLFACVCMCVCVFKEL